MCVIGSAAGASERVEHSPATALMPPCAFNGSRIIVVIDSGLRLRLGENPAFRAFLTFCSDANTVTWGRDEFSE